MERPRKRATEPRVDRIVRTQRLRAGSVSRTYARKLAADEGRGRAWGVGNRVGRRHASYNPATSTIQVPAAPPSGISGLRPLVCVRAAPRVRVGRGREIGGTREQDTSTRTGRGAGLGNRPDALGSGPHGHISARAAADWRGLRKGHGSVQRHHPGRDRHVEQPGPAAAARCRDQRDGHVSVPETRGSPSTPLRSNWPGSRPSSTRTSSSQPASRRR